MKYSVVIPTYNHCDDFLKPCIDSIIEYTDLADIELIVSANGCVDNTKQYLESLRSIVPNLKVVWSDAALGYPKATNLGIKAATCDKIVLLNNDCKLLPQGRNEWLNLLNGQFDKNDKCGVSCVVKEFSKVMRHNYAVFFCVMIDRKLFDEIGYLNEEYGTGSGEDMEFCILAEKNGYEICEVYDKIPLDGKYFTGNFPIYHFGEGTVHDKSLVPDWSSIFLRNSLRLAYKYNDQWNNMKLQNNVKIGVITPVYNDINHIFHAINSVKSQTVSNVHHYIYDDASTDGLQEGIKEFLSDPFLNYILGEKNCGQSFARNQAIKKALADGCEYIAFLDSDDYWYPIHLEACLVDMKDNDLIYSKPEFVDPNGGILEAVNIPVPHIFVGKHLLHNNYIWISSVVAKAKCFKTNEFDDELNSIEDWDMWIRLWKQGHTFTTKSSVTSRYLVRTDTQASKGGRKLDLLKQKHRLLPKLKLHLACGHDYDDDYINVDLYAPEDAKCDVRFDVQKLPYPSNSVDEIKAFHIIEHFHFFEIKEVLNEWFRVLKPGGRLYLETPDFLETCRSFVEGSPSMPIEEWRVLLYGHFFAHPWVPGQTHKFLFTENQLRTNLAWAGFKTVNRLAPASKYVMNHTVHMFLTVEAFKANEAEKKTKHDLSWLKNDDPENLFEEVIENNEYGIDEGLVKNKTVVDIGANIGMFSIFSSKLGAKKVVSVEPVSSTFDKLTSNIQKSGQTNIVPIKGAVHKQSGEKLKISLNNSSGHNNLYVPGEDYEEVTTLSISDVINDIDDDIIMKMDCEGAEYDILLNLKPNEFAKIKRLMLEVHADVHPIYRSAEVVGDKMKYLGFKLIEEKQAVVWDQDDYGNKTNQRNMPRKLQIWERV